MAPADGVHDSGHRARWQLGCGQHSLWATLGRRQHSVDGRDVLAGEYSEGPPIRRLRRARETTCMAREEERRLQEATSPDTPWKKWGPYLSERQWGTVREDYSETGDAWNYFSHDQAR